MRDPRRPVLLWAFLAAGALVACESKSPPPPDQALRDSLGISASDSIHRITLGGHGGSEHVVPTRLDVARGDLVEFLNVDRRIHTVVFELDRLGPEARRFLEETNQVESPPLLDGGARFVVTFEGAPAAEYPFLSEGPGGAEPGLIVVR